MKSMTGYGREEKVCGDLDILVEIKSVNHRYFEFSSRIPKAYGYIEAPVRNLIKEKVARGKIDVGIYIFHTEGRKAEVSVNSELAEGYVSALRSANDNLGLTDDITLSSLLEFPDIFNVVDVKDEEQTVIDSVLDVTGGALEAFMKMRITEGENLKKDILEKLEAIEADVGKVEEISPTLTENYYNRMLAKLNELIGSKEIDEQRIITEAALFSEKVAVDEETVRLRSHISQMHDIVESDGNIGKKLDFLVQEMNREVNTIGSKALDVDVTKVVVDMKNEIEKIREQIQNVE